MTQAEQPELSYAMSDLRSKGFPIMATKARGGDRRIEELEALYEAAVNDAQEAEAYAEELEAAFVNQAAATKRLRRKLEILKLDASKSRWQLFYDLQECLALVDIIDDRKNEA
jgi:hypothetical protein